MHTKAVPASLKILEALKIIEGIKEPTFRQSCNDIKEHLTSTLQLVYDLDKVAAKK